MLELLAEIVRSAGFIAGICSIATLLGVLSAIADDPAIAEYIRDIDTMADEVEAAINVPPVPRESE